MPDGGSGREERQRRREEEIARRERRKLRARRQKEGRGLLFGLGMFGLVGWSVAVPTLLGLALGLFLDARYPSRYSWTLTLLAGGIIVGCLNAWYWVSKEQEEIEKEKEEEHE